MVSDRRALLFDDPTAVVEGVEAICKHLRKRRGAWAGINGRAEIRFAPWGIRIAIDGWDAATPSVSRNYDIQLCHELATLKSVLDSSKQCSGRIKRGVDG